VIEVNAPEFSERRDRENQPKPNFPVALRHFAPFSPRCRARKLRRGRLSELDASFRANPIAPELGAGQFVRQTTVELAHDGRRGGPEQLLAKVRNLCHQFSIHQIERRLTGVRRAEGRRQLVETFRTDGETVPGFCHLNRP
jgi:hypothetical protein